MRVMPIPSSQVQNCLIIDILMTGQDLSLILLRVFLVKLGSFVVQRARANSMSVILSSHLSKSFILIGLPEQTLQTQKYRLHIVDCTPLVLENVEAYPPAEINVWMVDRRLEEYGRSNIRIVSREFKAKLEIEVCVWGVFGSDDGGGPV